MHRCYRSRELGSKDGVLSTHIMVTAFAFLTLAARQQGNLPIQFIPKAQLAFDRKDTILESKSGETPAMILVNDEDVSNEVLEAVTKNPNAVRLIELVRKEQTGGLVFWKPNGAVVANNDLVIPPAVTDQLATGDVGMILETTQAGGFPHAVGDKPTISINVPGSKAGRGFQGPDRHPYNFLKLGPQKFKFSNIRLAIRVNTYVDKFSAAVGTTKTISEINFKVAGPTPDQGDKLEHFEVLEVGFQGMEQLSLIGTYDWDSYNKEVHPLRPRNDVVYGRTLRKQGEPVDYKDMHVDFPSRLPVKYLSEITVLRGSAIQGFFQHIATEPNGS